MVGLSSLLEPFYKLLRSNVTFKWSASCESAFLKAKGVMCVSLAHYDPDVRLKFICDASNIGLGAVLMHVHPDESEKPISFASRVLNKHEVKYSSIHKEALAIYWAVNKFYQYLMGRHFILCSDNKPLAALLEENKGIPQVAAGRLQMWALFLREFDYTFSYIKGSDNGLADGLSRLPLLAVKVKEDDWNLTIFILY